MKTASKNLSPKDLRKKAEALVRKKKQKTGGKLSKVDSLKLIHELEVHQMQLELQTVELIDAKIRAEELAEKFTSLYDFAPTGYFTLSNKGKILELNLFGAQLLGKPRSALVKAFLGSLISEDTRSVFNRFLSDIFKGTGPQSCEATLKTVNRLPVFVQLTGQMSEQQDHCLVTMVDITERKHTQQKILHTIALTEENERTYFSGEIHDTLGSLLAAAKLYLHLAIRTNKAIGQDENMQKVEELVTNAYEIVQEIANKISPHLLKYFGLAAAIKRLIEKLEETTNLNFSFENHLNEALKFETEMILYRIIVECITNTIKHASASTVQISLRKSGERVQVRYRDDGVGFDTGKVYAGENKFGLFNIQNRIRSMDGEFNMRSSPGKGMDFQIAVNV